MTESLCEFQFLLFDRSSRNVVAEFKTLEEARAVLPQWPGCEVVRPMYGDWSLLDERKM